MKKVYSFIKELDVVCEINVVSEDASYITGEAKSLYSRRFDLIIALNPILPVTLDKSKDDYSYDKDFYKVNLKKEKYIKEVIDLEYSKCLMN